MNLLSFTLAEPQSFSPWEKLLLAGLDLASARALLAAIWPDSQANSRLQKRPQFPARPVGRRVWDFFWEVLCQAKVIRERPLPGLAHAFVFWGFCAFALVTLNHIAVGFGIGFLNPAGHNRRFLLLSCCSLCHCLRGWNLRSIRSPVSRTSPLARRQSLV